jgi:hypothetical protein
MHEPDDKNSRVKKKQKLTASIFELSFSKHAQFDRKKIEKDPETILKRQPVVRAPRHLMQKMFQSVSKEVSPKYNEYITWRKKPNFY